MVEASARALSRGPVRWKALVISVICVFWVGRSVGRSQACIWLAGRLAAAVAPSAHSLCAGVVVVCVGEFCFCRRRSREPFRAVGGVWPFSYILDTHLSVFTSRTNALLPSRPPPTTNSRK